jgi:hypothetical protein
MAADPRIFFLNKQTNSTYGCPQRRSSKRKEKISTNQPFPFRRILPNSRREGSARGKIESFTEREEWGSFSPLPEMSIRIQSLHLNPLSCQPVFWAEEGCTNSLIFFYLYGKIHLYERVLDRINSRREKKA